MIFLILFDFVFLLFLLNGVCLCCVSKQKVLWSFFFFDFLLFLFSFSVLVLFRKIKTFLLVVAFGFLMSSSCSSVLCAFGDLRVRRLRSAFQFAPFFFLRGPNSMAWFGQIPLIPNLSWNYIFPLDFINIQYNPIFRFNGENLTTKWQYLSIHFTCETL